jgi:hypothetical protein
MRVQEFTRSLTIERVEVGHRTAKTQKRRGRALVELLLNLRLAEAFDTTETLEELMRRTSRTAEARGLTSKILQEILNDTDD